MSRDMRKCGGPIEAILRGGLFGAMIAGFIHAAHENEYLNLLLFAFFVWLFFRADYGFVIRGSFAYITQWRKRS